MAFIAFGSNLLLLGLLQPAIFYLVGVHARATSSEEGCLDLMRLAVQSNSVGLDPAQVLGKGIADKLSRRPSNT